ncbi:flavin monoamine oxidase family protein [Planctomonas psychrotolerans]|uniref:flavin monoamine oxidase family protein n=1 Tax=Planctomonas psychrotolerans TaxID=2528712 RepID=UPI0012386BAB|nr:NAD(P)/FAD-dependent oxidoreductase [Planctomonas psychrotolerans]
MNRRTFVFGSAGGLTVLALAACTPEAPQPGPTGSPTPTPLPLPTVTPGSVPLPAASARSTWATDPYTRGSYSYLAPGATPEDRVTLRQPILDRLFFAGEATSTEAPGTVRGAIASGMRAAQEVAATADPEERIAVIGAGIAGATAARELMAQGFSVVVLEAQDRVGGRIRTENGAPWPFPVELGASFVSASRDTDLVAELEAADIATVGFVPVREIRLPDGETVPPSPVAEDAVARAVSWAAEQVLDTSLADALVSSGAADLSTELGEGGVSDADRLEHYLRAVVGVHVGATPEELSAAHGFERAGAPPTVSEPVPEPPPAGGAVSEPDDLLVVGGFSTLIDEALEGVDVLTKSPVAAVFYTDDAVSLRLGTGESLSVARVIVTVPIGVLNTDAIEFDPPLPFLVREAIEEIGMGALDKIWLRFEEPFWDTDARVWTILGGDHEYRTWLNLLPATGEPILVGLVAADAAARVAELSDADAVTTARASLSAFQMPDAEDPDADSPDEQSPTP